MTTDVYVYDMYYALGIIRLIMTYWSVFLSHLLIQVVYPGHSMHERVSFICSNASNPYADHGGTHKK